MTEQQNTTWKNRHETGFLDNLGRWGQARRDPKEMLRKYIKAARLRVNWDGMDAEVVVGHAQRLLDSY